MKLTKIGCLLVAGLVSQFPALTASIDADERILLPIVAPQPVPGAHGSLWTTHLTLSNQGEALLQVAGYGPCQVAPCIRSIEAHQTVFPDAYGSFLHVVDGRPEDLVISLRAHDLSRQLETWGTTIPVVTGEDLYTGRAVIGLNDIASGPDFRSRLRIYDFDQSQGRSVVVRVYEIEPGIPNQPTEDVLLSETRHSFAPASLELPHGSPGYIELPLPRTEDGLSRLRLEIEGEELSLRFWAFVTITNNNTQHVTIQSPTR